MGLQEGFEAKSVPNAWEFRLGMVDCGKQNVEG